MVLQINVDLEGGIVGFQLEIYIFTIAHDPSGVLNDCIILAFQTSPNRGEYMMNYSSTRSKDYIFKKKIPSILSLKHILTKFRFEASFKDTKILNPRPPSLAGLPHSLLATVTNFLLSISPL